MAAWQSIQATLDWIENNLSEDMSVNTLAGIAHLSPYYFQRLFRRIVGKPVMEYVKLRRLARVSNRLIFNRDTILESCFHYGFENHETFSRAFKEEYGITPTEFRKYTKRVRHFSKPALTEKGPYDMEYEVKIEELDEMRYLAIPNYVSMDDGSDAHLKCIKLWEKHLKDGSIDRLKNLCNTDTVYALFCRTYDKSRNMASYDFACINQNETESPEFRAITLRASKFAVLNCSCKAPMTKVQAYTKMDDFFWGEWLPKANYKSIIDYDYEDGSAAIELFSSLEADAGEFAIKIWYPVE